MTDCSNCGDPIPPPDPDTTITAAGGWCAPSEIAYSLPEPPPMCTDCTTRMLMIECIGIDPGRHGENLKVQRGGIQYPTPKEKP